MIKCPHCTNDDEKLIEKVVDYRLVNNEVKKTEGYRCDVCSKFWKADKNG